LHLIRTFGKHAQRSGFKVLAVLFENSEFGEPTAISRLHLMRTFGTHPERSGFDVFTVLFENSEFGEPTAISRLHLMRTFGKHPRKIRIPSLLPSECLYTIFTF